MTVRAFAGNSAWGVSVAMEIFVKCSKWFILEMLSVDLVLEWAIVKSKDCKPPL